MTRSATWPRPRIYPQFRLAAHRLQSGLSANAKGRRCHFAIDVFSMHPSSDDVANWSRWAARRAWVQVAATAHNAEWLDEPHLRPCDATVVWFPKCWAEITCLQHSPHQRGTGPLSVNSGQ